MIKSKGLELKITQNLPSFPHLDSLHPPTEQVYLDIQPPVQVMIVWEVYGHLRQNVPDLCLMTGVLGLNLLDKVTFESQCQQGIMEVCVCKLQCNHNCAFRGYTKL